MFTPEEVAKQKNISVTVLEMWEDVWKTTLKDTESDKGRDAFLYKCLGNGFSRRFGTAMYESIHRFLLAAGVPFDVD